MTGKMVEDDLLPPPPQQQKEEESKPKQAAVTPFTLVATTIPKTYTILEVVRDALPYAAGCALFRVVLQRVLRSLFFNGAQNGHERALRAALYVMSIANASLGMVFSVKQEPELRRFEKWERETGQSETIDRDEVAAGLDKVLQNSRRLTLSLLGYLLHDLIAILPRWRRQKADVVHHIMAWVIGLCIMHQPREMLRFVPGITLLESPTVLLNMRMAVKEFPALQAVPLLGRTIFNPSIIHAVFATSFTYLRMIWYPLFFNTIRVKKPKVWREVLGATRQTFAGLQYCIHVFWFYGLMKKMVV